MTGALTLALLLAMQGEALEPLVPEVAAPEVVAPETAPPDVAPITGTYGGVLGAASGCAIGSGVPAIVGGAGGGILYWLYSGAAAGTILGWTPALAALGTSCGILTSAVGLPLLGAGAAAAGAMMGAKNDGRDPMPALYGALPGVGLAAVSTVLSCTAMGFACGGLAAAQPVLILGAAAVLTGVAAPPCAAGGAAIADLAWGHASPAVTEAPLEKGASSTAMRF